jgi:hypothetical protein
MEWEWSGNGVGMDLEFQRGNGDFYIINVVLSIYIGPTDYFVEVTFYYFLI